MTGEDIPEELKYALVLLHRRVKSECPTRKDLVMTASMSLRWFPPTDAERLVDMAVDAGALREVDGRFVLGFDPKDVELPVGYTPTRALLRKRGDDEDVLLTLVRAIAESTGSGPKQVMARINAVVSEMNVDVSVAAMMLAQESGIDVSPFVDTVRAGLLRRYGGER